jgi:hypothetical protein
VTREAASLRGVVSLLIKRLMNLFTNLEVFKMNKEILVDSENALVLASAAFLVSRLSLHVINNVIGTLPEKDGDVLTTDVIEELALADLQRRIISKGDSK